MESLRDVATMSAIISITGLYSSSPSSPLTQSPEPLSASTRLSAGAAEDTVEISSLGRTLAEATETSSLRLARTRAIRAAIKNGTYETPARINGTVDRLLDVLG